MKSLTHFLHTHQLSHPLIALGLAAPWFAAAPFTHPLLLLTGVVAGTYWYHGREVRDTEVKLRINFTAGLADGSLSVRRAFAGWNFTNWTADEHGDFWPVPAVLAAVACGLFATFF